MRVGKAIKRIVALGTGLGMLGATVLGAMAADLSEYPSPFIKDGKFNGIIVVGADAATSDVIGSVDIATSLQYAAKTTTTVNVGTTEEVQLTGDSFKVETDSKKLELGEALNSIKQTIGEDELNALADGVFKNSKGSYTYEQNLKLAGNIVMNYTEDTDNDKVDVYLILDNGDQIANYTMTFSTPAETDIDSSSLEDFENRKISIMGKQFTIVDASLTNGDDVELTLMGGAVVDSLEEGASKTYTIEGEDYEVSVVYVDADEVKFSVTKDGETVTTNKLNVGDTETVFDQTIGVSEILYQDYAGGIHSVEFYFGADKVVLKDTDADASTYDGNMWVGENKIDDVDVMIKGSNSSDNTDWQLESVSIGYKSGDNYWIAAGEKLSDKLEEPEGLINWDIAFEGLTTEPTETIKVDSAGDKNLELDVKVADGEVSIPLAYSADASSLKLGEEDKDLVLDTDGSTGMEISKNDYFFLTDEATDSGKTYVLQYKGADSSTGDTMATLKFKNLATGETFEKSMDITGTNNTATLSLGGKDYTVRNVTDASAGTDDFNITVDGNVEGIIITDGKAQVQIVDMNGELNQSYVARTNGTTSDIVVNVTEADPADMLESGTQTVITFNITGGTASEIAVSEPTGITLKSDPDDSDVKTGMTKYGAFVKYTDKDNSPDEIEITWPAKQRVGQAFIISGPVQKTVISGAGEVETAVVNKIEVGAAVLDSEVSDIKAQNAIIVGGPCVNDAAADAMGLPHGSCGAASTIPANKAIIKLIEHDNGNVALVVAGWDAMDTRRACRVLANYEDYALSGKEVEVSGTSLTDINVAAPAEEVEEESAEGEEEASE